MRHSLFGKQLLVTLVILLGILQQHLYLLDTGIRHGQVVVGRRYGRTHGAAAGQRILVIGLGLSHPQAELGILDEQQRVALVHRLILLEINLLDKALQPAVYRHDVLTYLRIVGILDPPQMDESRADPYKTYHQQGDGHDVEYYFA